ncbi:MAG: YfiR family protein [Bacteroidales bacterium]|nr:YfiR family protein [Bacteroidales bacterium]
MIYLLKRYQKFLTRGLLPAVILFVAITQSWSQDLDYRAQSLYIYKFTKYIYWPEEKSSGEFIIGVYGNSPIYDELNLMASLKKAGNGQAIVVRKMNTEEDLMAYHLIYVASSKSRQIKTLSEMIEGESVLLVAEREGMANKGAVISFVISDYEILKFEINIKTLKQQNLSISDELVKLGYKL